MVVLFQVRVLNMALELEQDLEMETIQLPLLHSLSMEVKLMVKVENMVLVLVVVTDSVQILHQLTRSI